MKKSVHCPGILCSEHATHFKSAWHVLSRLVIFQFYPKNRSGYEIDQFSFNVYVSDSNLR